MWCQPRWVPLFKSRRSKRNKNLSRYGGLAGTKPNGMISSRKALLTALSGQFQVDQMRHATPSSVDRINLIIVPVLLQATGTARNPQDNGYRFNKASQVLQSSHSEKAPSHLMSTSSPSATPAPYANDSSIVPPIQVITDTDKAGIIIVVTTFFLVSIWITLILRVYIRLKINGPWKWDDYCIAGATVLSCTRSAVTYVEVSRGYGKSTALLEGGDFVRIGNVVFADNILFILAMLLSKCSVILLCKRLTPAREHYIAIWATLGLSAIWALAYILLISIGCTPASSSVNTAATCAHLAARWKAVCALDVLTEIALFFISIYLVFGLKMSLYVKGVVIAAFGIRLPVIILSSLRLIALDNEISSLDPTLIGAYTAALTQAELDYSIIASTFSSMGAFLKPFTKEIGPSRSDHEYGYQLSAVSGNRSVNQSANVQSQRRSIGEEDAPVLRNDVRNGTTAIVSNGASPDRLSLASNDSKKRIITKEVQWSVEREGGSRPISAHNS